MASAHRAFHGAAGNGTQRAHPHTQPQPQFTTTALGRWSVLSKPLPSVDKIKALHVYDFDNTLFKTPLPNATLWSGPTIGLLSSQDVLVNGGWWHDNRILAATGQGQDKELPRAWEGWWNETIVELVRLSIKQPDALCVLLTGRSEDGFAHLVKGMVASKGLDFDMAGLKPAVSPENQRFQSTMHFKQLFLNALMETYTQAEEIKIYEDRPKHTKGFREFLAEYNRRQHVMPTRGPLTAEVVQVAETCTSLDPVVEVAEVQHMINIHNDRISKQARPPPRRQRLGIKKTVFFTGYMISPEDTQKLIKLANIPHHIPNHELIVHANNILICPRPCPTSILEKVGGMGSRMIWEVNAIACSDNNIWAARLRPIPSAAKYHTDTPVPLVVIALRKGVRPKEASQIENWQPLPPEQCFVLDTVVGERVILRIEPDVPGDDEYESLFANKSAKRKHGGDDDRPPHHNHGPHGGRNESRSYHTGARGGASQGRGRGGRGYRSGPRGGGRGGRGRGGGNNNYRSLDDVEPRNSHRPAAEHDDSHRPQGPPTGPQGYYGNDASRGGRSRGQSRGGAVSADADLQKYY